MNVQLDDRHGARSKPLGTLVKGESGSDGWSPSPAFCPVDGHPQPQQGRGAPTPPPCGGSPCRARHCRICRHLRQRRDPVLHPVDGQGLGLLVQLHPNHSVRGLLRRTGEASEDHGLGQQVLAGDDALQLACAGGRGTGRPGQVRRQLGAVRTNLRGRRPGRRQRG